MNKIKFWEITAIMLLIPAIIGVIFIKTLIGALLLVLSAICITIIATIVNKIKKDTPIKFIILGDVTTILLISVVASKYYFKRNDITMFICIIFLAFVLIFCIIDTINRKKKI